VVYNDHGLFQGERILRLRARFRTVEDEEYNDGNRQIIAGVLGRQGDSFTGKFVVANGAVFGAFAVEDSHGKRVDSNGERLWTQLAQTGAGHPTFDALTQAMYDVMGVSLEAALAILQRRAKEYPNSVEGWEEVVGYEDFMLGRAHTDSTLKSHMRRLIAFHNEYKSVQHVPIRIADGLLGYAIQLESETNPEASAIGKFWNERVRADTTRSRRSRGRRLSAFVRIAKKDSQATLDSMDKAWQEGDSLRAFVGNGLNFALEAKDSARIGVWSNRFAAAHRNSAAFAYGPLLIDVRLREMGLSGLRQTMRNFYAHGEEWRPLDQTVAEYAREDTAKAAEVLAKIAEGLALSGAISASLDTMAVATKAGWNPTLFKLAGDAYLRAGDTTNALREFAMVAVDPREFDSVSSLTVQRLIGHRTSLWTALEDTARFEMQHRVMADAISRPLAVSPRIAAQDGRLHQLKELAGNSVHVVTFWSRYCAPSRRDFAQLDTFARNLSKHGILLFPVSVQSPSEGLRTFIQEEKVTVPLFYDTKREAGRAFNQWSTPVYFVLDETGLIRFANSSIDKVVTQAVAVQYESTHRHAAH
jgi:peroxiredoxin